MSVGASTGPEYQLVVTPLIVGDAPVRIVVQFGNDSDGWGTTSDTSVPYVRSVFSEGMSERDTSSRMPSTMTSTTRPASGAAGAGLPDRSAAGTARATYGLL